MSWRRGLPMPRRASYRHIEAVVGRIADLENVIDPIAAYLGGKEKDPAFTGFHRIEYGLWNAARPKAWRGCRAACRRCRDAKDRLKGLRVEPSHLVSNASREARRLAEGPVVTGDNLYAHDDLAEFAAAIDGLEKPVSLLMPLVSEGSPDVAKAIADAFVATRAEIAPAGGYRTRYTDVSRTIARNSPLPSPRSPTPSTGSIRRLAWSD